MLYDLIIIGAAPAGISAGIYAARRGLNFKIIASDLGGEMATSGEIGNWPGEPETDGIELTKKFKSSLDHYKIEPELGVWVESVNKRDDGTFAIVAKKGEEELNYQAKTVILSTGVHPRKLGIPGEEEFRNKGVSYCTTCDGPLFKGNSNLCSFPFIVSTRKPDCFNSSLFTSRMGR